MSAKVMLIAGELSGDTLGAELVHALRNRLPAGSSFFGAGGPRMARAGVELAFDLTQHAVIGLWDVLRNYLKFRRLFQSLVHHALDRRPDIVVCIDFSGFNRRFAHALRIKQRANGGSWTPKIVQFVSPQVWASRPGRARQMVQDFDLLLSIFPFEKPWYAKHAPEMRVEFVGHPMLDRYSASNTTKPQKAGQSDLVLLLPGSRKSELRRHLPVMSDAAFRIAQAKQARFRIVIPQESLLRLAQDAVSGLAGAEIQVGRLPESLAEARVALACTGTVTMECAFFRIPTITLYKTNWSTYQIGRRIITVPWLTMPNLLANEAVYPEFVQDSATGENIANAALALMENNERRAHIVQKLDEVISSLGKPGATGRAAEAISSLVT